MSEFANIQLEKEAKKPILPTSSSNFSLPKLPSVYNTETRPFTTYIPYEPLPNETSTQEPQPESQPQQQPQPELQLKMEPQLELKPEPQLQSELKQQQQQQHQHQQEKRPELKSQLKQQYQLHETRVALALDPKIYLEHIPPTASSSKPESQSQSQFLSDEQQELELQSQQKHVQRPGPPASSVIIFKQEKPKRSNLKKSDKPFICKHPGCTWAFARHSDLTRHSKSHAPPQYQCPYWKNDPTCHRKDGSFNRLDVLKRHLRLIHYVKDKQPFGEVYPGDDPGWCRSCQRMFTNSKTFLDHCNNCAQNTTPTEWIEIKKEGGDANPNQATFRVNLDQSKKSKYND